MSARRRSPGLSQLSMWLGLLLHGALLVSVHLIEDDRWASVAALRSFAVCLASCLFLLRLNGLSPAVVYANVLAVFHLGLAVPWALGVASDPLPRWLLTHPLRPAMTLVMVAFAAYQVGATIAVWRWPGQRRPGKTAKTYHNKVLFDCGLVLTAVGIGALVWGIHTLGFDRLANATYFETYRLVRTYDPRFFISSLQIVPMGLYLAAASAPLNRLAIVLGVGGAWAGCIFLLGFRGFALVPILTLLAVLSKRGFRLPVSAYAVGVLIAMLAIPAVRVFRADPLAQRSLGGLLVASHPFEALQEMGGSLRPLVHTLELLDDESFRWGQSYWQAAKLVVPNLETEWQGDSYIPLEQLPLSHWVSKLAAPWSYQNYGGLGFSAVAEPYMNFGPAGVVVYFLLLGGALVWVDRIDASRPIRLAVWAMVLGPMLWTTRNTLAVFFRPAVWGICAAFGAHLLSRSLSAVKNPRSAAPVAAGGRFARRRYI